ncbi:MAG: ATP-grasp domain-containing protein [Candidatus Hermodarchaeota archaeon]
MAKLKIGILTKRKEGFTGKIKDYLQKQGHKVELLLEDNLMIDNTLLNNDFYILKSKKLIYLYAAYFLVTNNIIVIPDVHISHVYKNRVESYLALHKNAFLTPKVYIGTANTFKAQLKKEMYPLILKPIMSSGSKGVRIINSINDLNLNSDEILYLEEYIDGTHYLVYFIEDKLCICEKKPLVNEHEKVKIISNDGEIKNLVFKWKNSSHVMFGHVDMVRESSTNNLYIVDVGTFPEFSNWKGEINPVEKISELILSKYTELVRNKSE